MYLSFYDIVYCSNTKYLPHLAASLISLLSNNRRISFCIYIINNDIDEIGFLKLRNITNDFNCNLFDIKVQEALFENFKLSGHIDKQTYYRLLIPNLVNAKRVVYLDADLIVLGSIEKILNIDLLDYPIAAVENPGFKNHSLLGMNPDSKYFNAGVLVMNLEMWRSENLANKVINFIQTNSNLIEFWDQCALNAILNGRWFPLDPAYNFQASFYNIENQKNLVYKNEDIISASNNPIIVHFSGSSKPWHIHNKHPYRKKYWFYRNLTPFKSLFSDDFNIKKVVSKFLPLSFRKFILQFIRG